MGSGTRESEAYRNWIRAVAVLSGMHSKPDLQALTLRLAQLESQIGEQKLLVDVLRELGDAAEAAKAESRLNYLEESYGAVILYRDLLAEELNKTKCVH